MKSAHNRLRTILGNRDPVMIACAVVCGASVIGVALSFWLA